MDDYRIEHDSMGEVLVPESALWGAQTQRSYENFPIGIEVMPADIIYAFALIKRAAAEANAELGVMSADEALAIAGACDEICTGAYADHFPLPVWQTGSGTQTNMNVNEVVARLATTIASDWNLDVPAALHPNDIVNRSQSSNDTFPAAMHVAAVLALTQRLLPAAHELCTTFSRLENEYAGIIKSGRTHLQDAVPIAFSQEISGWRGLVEAGIAQIEATMPRLRLLALGGTAVGTGLNAPAGFDTLVAERISALAGEHFSTDPNKFAALTGKDALATSHGAIKALAANLMKIANDVRWLASGPRLGIGEISIPANEPGSSIMPGKVNPTQCEALVMVAIQVMGNDTTIGIAASQGNFELNVCMPVIAYNYLQSTNLLADALISFNERCASGIAVNRERMEINLRSSLMLVTALSPHIGYERAARVAQSAYERGVSLRDACVNLGYLSAEEFDDIVKPEEMI